MERLRVWILSATALTGLAIAAPPSGAAEPCGLAICGNACGQQEDGCGNLLECGPCLPPMCGNGICQRPRGESFETCAVDCPTDCIQRTCENRCGWVPNGCGGLMNCGGCSSSCTPHGCRPGEPGQSDDGCGQTINCGASSSSCGNHVCDAGENCTNCPGDCSTALDFTMQVEAGPGLCSIPGGGFDESIWVGTTVRFMAVPSTLNQEQPAWNFGDGSMGAGLNASHTYTTVTPAEVTLYGFDAHCGTPRETAKRLGICRTTQYDLDTARVLMQMRKWAEAEVILRTLPGATATKMLSKCLSRQGRFGVALPLASDGVSDCGSGPFPLECEDALYGLGESLVGLRRYSEAVARLSPVISSGPADVGRKWAYYFRGIVYGNTNHVDLMIADFETFLGFDCESDEAASVKQLLSAVRSLVPQTAASCAGDPPQCGNDVCQTSLGESASNCWRDCHCGDNVCQTQSQCQSRCLSEGISGSAGCRTWCYQRKENSSTCPQDCGYLRDTTVAAYFPKSDAATEAAWDYVASEQRGVDAFAGLSLSFLATSDGILSLATQSAGPIPPLPSPVGAQPGTPQRSYSTATWRQSGTETAPEPIVCLSHADVAFPAGSGSPSLFERRDQEWVDVTTERKEPKAVCGQPEVGGLLAVFTTHNQRPSVTLPSVECHPLPSSACAVTAVADGRDPDGDTLTYEWVGCTGTGASAVCTVPALGAVPIGVVVRDGKGGLAKASATATGVNRAATITWFGFSEPEPLGRNQDAELYFTIDDDDVPWSSSCHVYATGQCTLVEVDCADGVVAFRTKAASGLCRINLRWTDRWGVVTPPEGPQAMAIFVQ